MTTPLVAIDVHTVRGPQPLPPSPFTFPDAATGPRDGPVAFGGDLAPSTIVDAYRAGLFPWPHSGEDRWWFSPDPRAVLPAGGIHISARLARRLRQGGYDVTIDAAFAEVVAACAVREEGTWITAGMAEAYTALHRLGWAHSVEVWDGGTLVGGLYGLGVGALFGAESMFHRATDASKIAMVALCQHARQIGIELIDVQMQTPHLASMGVVEMPRAEYLSRVRLATESAVDWRVSLRE